MCEIVKTLSRIQDILQNHPGDSADWLGLIIGLHDSNEQEFYRELNSKRMWGGAGSIANQAMADNPGMDEWQWRMEVRELRELLITLGEHLQARGNHYPDISSWLLAFSNWNQSGI